MLSMLGGQGMGSAGMGAGASPSMPSGMGGLSPQMIAMLMQQQGGQNVGSPQVTPQPGPFQASPTGTPMAGYIGAGGNPGAMRPMQGAPVGQPPGMGGAQGAAAPAAGGAISPQTLQMIQMLKGQQNGVPAGGTLPIAQNPNTLGGGPMNDGNSGAGGMMGWLQSLFSNGGGGGAVAPAGGLT